MSNMVRSNSTLDDIAGVIGFTPTLRLVAWYGDVSAQLYVPSAASPDHDLARLIGMQAFELLCREWGNEHLAIPTMQAYHEDCRNRKVKDLLEKGHSPREIARYVDVGERRVQQIRVLLEQVGLMPLVLGGKKPTENGA